MNKLCCLIIMFITYGVCSGQNLVPNPSFEDTLQCPDNISGMGDDQVSRAVGWSTFRKTPDYFHSCASPSFWAVPDNLPGFQYAHTGEAYCGIITWDTNTVTTVNWREFIGTQLTSPLIIGQKYYVSFYVNWAGKPGATAATNKMGVLLSTISYNYNNPAPINNSPTFYTDSVITDSINWVLIKGSFIADSAYQYLIIGNFFNDANSIHLNFGPYPFRAYYFIDDVCISTDSLTCYSPVGVNEIKNESQISLFPNPFHDKLNITIEENKTVKMNLYDVTARKIFNQSFTNSISINTEQLAKGIYLYEVRNKNGVIKKGKVVKD